VLFALLRIQLTEKLKFAQVTLPPSHSSSS
jgi:hypothetical protein